MRSAHFAILLVMLTPVPSMAAEDFDAVLKEATLEYGRRLEAANQELSQTRQRIEEAKAPLLQDMRQAEQRLFTVEADVVRLQTSRERWGERFRELQQHAEVLQKNTNFLDSTAFEAINAFIDGALPAGRQLLDARAGELRAEFEATRKMQSEARLIEIADLLADEVERSLGGRIVPGSALVDGTNEMVEGRFALAGPELFFLAANGTTAGTVRVREGTNFLAVHPLSDWTPQGAASFFRGEAGTIFADSSGGKALQLKETTGTFWQHVEKGGLISYVILSVGALALALLVLKVRDVAQLRVDAPEAMGRALLAAGRDGASEVEQAIKGLQPVAREVFATALLHVRAPLETIEGHVNAVLLRHRGYAERMLPLLAVIATAAPLLGLLGTVTGMVRTFALITVFGTGDASKLASGISEVLIATELGLAVAIPTLIAHGFLAHSVQRKVALLERHALEFVTRARQNESLVGPADAVSV